MDRRSFLTNMVGGVAMGAAVRTWPFRVYSFASEPIVAGYAWRVKIFQWDQFVRMYPHTAAAMKTFNGFRVTRTEDWAVIHFTEDTNKLSHFDRETITAEGALKNFKNIEIMWS